MPDLVLYSHRGPAALITINRPDKRNALSRGLIAALTDAFHRAAADSAARCVILTGAGPAFCAGMDLEELRSTLGDAADKVWDDANKLAALYDLIYTLPKPTVAAVNGPAVAGGAGLVSVCDLAFAVQGAKFGYPEVLRGLVAAMVMPHLLRHVGERAARHLLLTGALIDAEEAFRIGFINGVIPSEYLMIGLDAEAKALAEAGPMAIARTKELLRTLSRQSLSVEELAKASAAPRLTDEARQGIAAFFDKKPAPWVPGEPRP